VAKSRSTIEVIPSASRLIRSLRDVGYDFVHAVADLVDNSIAAKATEVAIELRFDGEDSWVRVVDNGTGMSGTTITEAMRFGSERDYAPDDLGKFGLGLKTASLSQCSRLTVASRTDPASRKIEARQWDLAHVEKANRWEIIDLSADERPHVLTEPLQERRGTVVLWEWLDRVLGYKIPWGDKARTGFLRTAEQLDEHLGMVFHRFLSGEARWRKKVKITINSTVVRPWDPFAREEKATIPFDQREFDVPADGGRGLVRYAAYVLPHQDRFSTPRAFNHYAGPSKWNYQQGFYIYRADRMIQSGGWCYMRTCDEHTKLARVALDFLPDLDSAFELNVSKARVNLPADLKNQMKPHIENLVKQARKVYGSGPKAGTRLAVPVGGDDRGDPPPIDVENHSDGHHAGEKSRDRAPEPANGREDPPAIGAPLPPTRKRVGRAIESAAERIDETKALNRIKQSLKEYDPEAANDIGW